MSTSKKRTSITILPEWEDDIRKLKQEQFYDKTKSDMIRYLIQLGLEQAKKPQESA